MPLPMPGFLKNTFNTVNQYLAKNNMLHWVDAMEKGIAKLVPVHVVRSSPIKE
ncbi:hypothetical protein DSO57_1002754 [Entomophthora muscae]|uniref:Uncharacterized protein n=1 Tax=Entomophthora muscae TaxID=34485 RepID=A0ACC2RNJ1_9FUNG|nr:hypothetical protein DSO57_1002754 [Entomophthora muscae]